MKKNILINASKTALSLAVLMISTSGTAAVKMSGPFNTPEYFAEGNYAYSPLPEICSGADTTAAGGHCITTTPVGTIVGGLHKFVDGMPKLHAGACGPLVSNNLGQCLEVAIPDKTTYPAISTADVSGNPLNIPATDYYSLELGEYKKILHSDFKAAAASATSPLIAQAPTSLRGYHQLKTTPAQTNFASQYQYMSPFIIAAKGVPTRIKLTNSLQKEIPLPVDQSYFGAGSIDYNGTNATPLGNPQTASTKRSNLHLHGGDTPWISDGTPHTWITPANDLANASPGYSKGLSFQNVPDMINNGWLLGNVPCVAQTSPSSECITESIKDGVASYYYPNGQTSRMMFFHDHSFGITRLNVYMGEAAGYLLADKTQEDAIKAMGVPGAISVDVNTTVNPPQPTGVNLAKSDINHIIPLVLQDRTFVPDNGQPGGQLAAQDPTWPAPRNALAKTDYANNKYWLTTSGSAANGWGRGSLWLPHVYVTNQLPFAISKDALGNPVPPSTVAPLGRWDYTPWMGAPLMVNQPPVACKTPAYPGKKFYCPATKNPTAVPESFMDSIMVNGTVYPHLDLKPDAYRFKILNAADDRFFNMGLYIAATQDPIATIVDTTPASLAPGVGAVADVNISINPSTKGQIESFNVLDQGINYPPSKKVTLTTTHTSASSIGGLAIPAQAYVTIDGAGNVIKLIIDDLNQGTGYQVGDTVQEVTDATNVTNIYGSWRVASAACQSATTDCSILTLDPVAVTSPAPSSGLPIPPVVVKVNYGIEPADYAALVLSQTIVEGTGIATVNDAGGVIDIIPDPLFPGSGYVEGGRSCENIATNLVSLCTEVVQTYPIQHANTCSGSNALLPNIDGLGLVHVPNLRLGRTGMSPSCWPDTWPSDGNAHSGLVADATTAGPPIIQLGNEGGLLPKPVIIPSTPISYNYNRKMATLLGFTGGHGLALAPAQRADAVIDFHGFAPSTTDGNTTTVLIAYNDNPAPAPLFDTRFDMYTGDPDQSGSGGAPSTLPGFGPNTRTMFQIRVSGAGTSTNKPINTDALMSPTTGIPALFASTQDQIIVPQPDYPKGNGNASATTVATFDTVQLPNADSGTIGGISITNGGSYAEPPAISIVPTDLNGSGATATAVLDSTSINNVVLTSKGSGYTVPPTVTLSNVQGVGTGGSFAAVLTPSGISTSSLRNSPNTNTGYAVGASSTLKMYNGGVGAGIPCTGCATLAYGVDNISISSGGSYLNAPTLTIGPTGTDTPTSVATATPVMSSTGSINSVTIPPTAPVCPAVTIAGSVPFTVTTGGGSGFAGNITFSSTGTVTAVQVTNPGSGYPTNPTTSIVTNLAGCTGASTRNNTNPLNTLILNVYTSIQSVNITIKGDGYYSAPTVSATPPAGIEVGAVLNATASGYVSAINQALITTAAGVIKVNSNFVTFKSAVNPPITEKPAYVDVVHKPTTIKSVNVLNSGSGYTSSNMTVTFTPNGTDTPVAAVAQVQLAPRPIASINVTSGGSGYTSVPNVVVTKNLATYNALDGGAVVDAYFLEKIIEYKGIAEGFDPIWGTLNVELADSIPAPGTPTASNFRVAAAMPYGYVDPPSEMVADQAVSQWRIDHIGVDAHSLHFHLFNVQVVNYLDIAGQTYMPDSNQIGWNETVRTEPFTSVFVAMRTKNVPIPWELPNSIRAMDTSSSLGTVNGPAAVGNNPGCITNPFALQPLIGPVCVPFTTIDPTGNAVVVTNALINYGSEYVYHCHLLSHEEHDMMRPISFAVAPKNAPKFARRTGGGNNNNDFIITDNSFNETDFIIESSTDGGATWSVVGDVQTGTGTTKGIGVHGTTYASLGTPVTMVGIQTVNAQCAQPGAALNCGIIQPGTPNPLVPQPAAAGTVLSLPQVNGTTYRVSAANIVGCNWSVPALSNGSVPTGGAVPPACSDIFVGWPSIIANSPSSAPTGPGIP